MQLGKRLGATVYATTSTEQKAEVARRRGAAAVFLYDRGSFADRVREHTSGRGVDVVFDSDSGKPTFRDSLRATLVPKGCSSALEAWVVRCRTLIRSN